MLRKEKDNGPLNLVLDILQTIFEVNTAAKKPGLAVMKEKRLMHGKIIDARRSQQKHSSARPPEQGSCSKQDVIDEDVDVQYHTNIFTFHFHFTLFISSSTVPEDSAEQPLFKQTNYCPYCGC